MNVHPFRAPPGDHWEMRLMQVRMHVHFAAWRGILGIARMARQAGPLAVGVLRSGNATPQSLEGTDMTHPYNGIPAPELTNVTWQKSRHSNPNGACVEVAHLPNGEIAVRNSRFPSGPALVYTREEIAAFLAGAKDGEFDHVL